MVGSNRTSFTDQLPKSELSGLRFLVSGFASSRRPVHLPFREEMEVQVRNGLAGERAVVHDEAESVAKLKLSRHDARHQDEMTENGLITRRGFTDPRDHFLRHNQQVDGRLRLDVVEHDAMLILMLDAGGNFTRDDPLKNCFGHGDGL